MKYQIISICLICALKITGQESALLDTNDVSIVVYSDGTLFNGKFQVPKGGRNLSLNGNIWIGGYDQYQHLHLAAQTFRNNTSSDLFYGPVAMNYYDTSYLSTYNNVWKINKSTIEEHIANYKKPGYILPKEIEKWPGNGNVINGEAAILAPFIDVNSNKIYDPVNGDYPEIRGDQAVFFIANDAKEIHTKSNSEMLDIEVHGLVYMYVSQSDSALNQTVFVNYELFNRSLEDYKQVYLGIFTEMSFPSDFIEYVGCDSSLNTSYIYNGNSNDLIFGTNSPAHGCIILNQNMSSYMYYNNPSAGNPPYATGDPNISIEYYRYLTGLWKNGTPLTRGGIGYNPGSIDTAKFAFNGDPNGTGWTQLGDIAGDRRGVTSIGPIDFKAGSKICVDIAFPYARDYKGNNLTSVSLLKQRAQTIQTFYNMQGYNCQVLTTSIHQTNNDANSILFYPNPGHGIFTLGHSPDQLSKNAKIEIYNSFAQKIYQSSYPQVEKTNIDISSQPGGIYFVKIFDGKKWTSKKLIIQ